MALYAVAHMVTWEVKLNACLGEVSDGSSYVSIKSSLSSTKPDIRHINITMSHPINNLRVMSTPIPRPI